MPSINLIVWDWLVPAQQCIVVHLVLQAVVAEEQAVMGQRLPVESNVVGTRYLTLALMGAATINSIVPKLIVVVMEKGRDANQ